MRIPSWCASAFGLALLLVLPVGSAHAQATRTWVSGVGDDVNPCSRTAPCKTFAGAISKTAAGGEINCLDPGGFGAVTITKSISIICEVEAGVLVSGTNGIVVNTPTSTSKVLLEGLDIEGLGTGLDGIKIIGSGRVDIRRCSIRNFAGNGINLSAAANARVLVTDSFIVGNGANGLLVQGIGGAANNAVLDRTTIESNGSASIKLGVAASLVISGSVLSGSGTAIDATAGGTVTSYGNSVIRPAATINTPLPRQ